MDKEIKEVLGFILDKLNELDTKVDNLESSMGLRIDNLESKMELRIDNFESKMELRIDNLESKMELRMDNLELRQDEIYLVVKAIEHNNQVHRAEIDNLKYTVNNVEGTLNSIGDVITKRKAI
ncbi:hypothetical protein [Desulfosporosinus youngiae]|uniref:Uncharacterized protein n=1 Tax=Desulfosporosinus youngiae DSM 17734 TaxID=768710 RepID=H5XZJ4_9FIRM|nr:hypothetical protein [Desulfosporosinus youngiae]EHQ91968.1 hypothetical protein DesyoDRAFT_5033 [Desulfosporosinus youngiae DSM 17734]